VPHQHSRAFAAIGAPADPDDHGDRGLDACGASFTDRGYQ